jgi:hypothetical protein
VCVSRSLQAVTKVNKSRAVSGRLWSRSGEKVAPLIPWQTLVPDRCRIVECCRKAKFNCPLPGSPSGRPLTEAPNRAILANSWNGYEGVFDYLIGVAILVILVRVFPIGVFLSHHVIDDIGLDVTRNSCPWVACRFSSISSSAGGAWRLGNKAITHLCLNLRVYGAYVYD